MISASALSHSLLALLCFDKERAPDLALRLDPKLFVGRTNQRIAATAVDYVKQFSTAPGVQLELILEADLRRGEEGRLLGQTLDILAEQMKELNADFIVGELETWERSSQINRASQEAIEAVARGDLAAAEAAFQLAYPQKQEGTPGIWLSDVSSMMKGLDRAETDWFSSGVEAFDKLGLVPERKTVTCWMASTGKGKTWSLVNIAKAGFQHRKKVLYITLEISEEKLGLRVLQAIFGLTKKEAREIDTAFFELDAQGNNTVQFRKLTRSGLVESRKDIQKKLASMSGYAPFLIKEFPTGQLSMAKLRLYLDQLKKQGFEPDLLIIDQAGNMQLDADNLRIATGRLWVDLRGIAMERNLALVSASQGNRSSENAQVVDKDNVAEDWSIMGTCDAVFTYSQTPAEYKLGLSRLLAAKYRDETDRVMVLNSQSYATGQFSLDSVLFQRGVAAEVERLTGS